MRGRADARCQHDGWNPLWRGTSAAWQTAEVVSACPGMPPRWWFDALEPVRAHAFPVGSGYSAAGPEREPRENVVRWVIEDGNLPPSAPGHGTNSSGHDLGIGTGWRAPDTVSGPAPKLFTGPSILGRCRDRDGRCRRCDGPRVRHTLSASIAGGAPIRTASSGDRPRPRPFRCVPACSSGSRRRAAPGRWPSASPGSSPPSTAATAAASRHDEGPRGPG